METKGSLKSDWRSICADMVIGFASLCKRAVTLCQFIACRNYFFPNYRISDLLIYEFAKLFPNQMLFGPVRVPDAVGGVPGAIRFG